MLYKRTLSLSLFIITRNDFGIVDTSSMQAACYSKPTKYNPQLARNLPRIVMGSFLIEESDLFFFGRSALVKMLNVIYF